MKGDGYKLFFVVSGYYCDKQGRVLMVGNQWREDEPVYYSLPGGIIKTDSEETLMNALSREFKEETETIIKETGDLLYVVESVSKSRKEHFINLTFEVFNIDHLNGVQSIADEFVVDMKYVAKEEINDLSMLKSFREPLLNYMSGSTQRYYLYMSTFEEDC